MRQYETFELEFQGAEPTGSQAAVDLKVVFVQGSSVKEIKGFYAGNGIYKVRYYPQETGTVTWEVISDLPLSGTLKGVEECLPADEHKHGMVQADGIHFRYEDGTRYIAMGTTVYAFFHQEKERIDQTMQTLETAPFNKVRCCVFPKSYDFNHNEPETFAFEKTDGKWDVNRPCFKFWDAMETRILQMQEMKIETDLILFHPYDCWGFAELTKKECITYLDYTLRRLSAIPGIWWSLANEYDLMEHFEREWWFDFSKFIHENDAYGHLLSNHHCLEMWDFSDLNTSHCCIQGTGFMQTPDLQKKYGKPVVFDECGYEGTIPYAWGNISGFEMVNRFWTAFVMGAYCSHGETFWNEEEVLWWAKGGILHGESPARIKFMRQILEELPGDLEAGTSQFDRECLKAALADPETAATIPYVVKSIAKLDDSAFQNFMEGNRELTAHCQEEVYLQYWARHCSCWCDMTLPQDKKYDVEVIDIWNMTKEKKLEMVSGLVHVPMPGKEGIVVLAKRVG